MQLLWLVAGALVQWICLSLHQQFVFGTLRNLFRYVVHEGYEGEG
jgi:hypothetical protein